MMSRKWGFGLWEQTLVRPSPRPLPFKALQAEHLWTMVPEEVFLGLLAHHPTRSSANPVENRRFDGGTHYL